MAKAEKRPSKFDWLHAGRAVVALFAILVAAGHLAFTIPLSSGSGTPAPAHTGNQTTIAPGTHSAGGFSSFNELGFWFDVETIAYAIIAVVFLLGLRTWYTASLAFNIFNLGIYFISGITPIPGITGSAFGGRFTLPTTLSTINIIVVSWIAMLIIGFVLLKYDPGSELDGLILTKRKK